jgi:hypothetical protein
MPIMGTGFSPSQLTYSPGTRLQTLKNPEIGAKMGMRVLTAA